MFSLSLSVCLSVSVSVSVCLSVCVCVPLYFSFSFSAVRLPPPPPSPPPPVPPRPPPHPPHPHHPKRLCLFIHLFDRLARSQLTSSTNLISISAQVDNPAIELPPRALSKHGASSGGSSFSRRHSLGSFRAGALSKLFAHLNSQPALTWPIPSDFFLHFSSSFFLFSSFFNFFFFFNT